MSNIKVDPDKLQILSAKLMSLGDHVENAERSIHQDISRLLQELRHRYHEWNVQQALNDVEDRLGRITTSARAAKEQFHTQAGGLKQAARAYGDSEKAANNAISHQFIRPSSFYAKQKGVSGKGLSAYLEDPMLKDPVVQQLHEQALNGSAEEKKKAKKRLDVIFKARYDIARAQTAYSVYQGFANKSLMDGAHKEAERLRKVLKHQGVSEDYYGKDVSLTQLYKGTPLTACSFDPSFQITKGGKFVPIPLPRDNQYLYLLGLVMKGGAAGAWAKAQLTEIHKMLAEIGRAQVAWNEYKAKNMTDEMKGAHAYAEKLRQTLKSKYSLSSEMTDDVDYKMLWTGTGPAGKALDVQKTKENTPQTGDLVTLVQQIVFGNEGSYETVVKDDGKNPKTGYPGGVSVGRLQWHESRAYDLIVKIMKQDIETAKRILGENSKVYKELTDTKLAKSKERWKARVLTDEEKKAISRLISTDTGKRVQDEQAKLDVQGYITAGKKLGITDERVLIYFSDLYNQGPARAEDIVQAAGGGKGLTLEKIHKFALDDRVMGDYVSRRNTTFNKINQLSVKHPKKEINSKPNNTGSTNQKSQMNNKKLDVERIDQKPINKKGCAIASFAMLANFYGANTSFRTVESKYVNKSYMLNFSQAAKAYGLKYSEKRGLTESEVLSLAKKSLDRGEPVIIQIYGKSKGVTYTHFVVAIGYTGDGKQAGDFIINDPWGGIETTLNKAQRYKQAPVSSIRFLTKE